MGEAWIGKGGLPARLAALTLLLVALPAHAQAAVTASHSGWRWGSPLPQGQTLRAFEFSGERGFAAGDFGTLLRTEDSGATWRGVASGTTETLDRVGVVDADTVVAAGGCALRRSDDYGRSFRRVPWGAGELGCAASIAAVGFSSDRAGYLALSDGSLLGTGDGGATWSARPPLPGTQAAGGTEAPTGLAFPSPERMIAVTSGGRIYRSADGAQTWSLRKAHPRALRDLFFVGSTIGYAVGDGGSVLRTADGGLSWTLKPAGALDFRSIRCAGASRCLLTVAEGDELLLTTNGATSFYSTGPSGSRLFAAAFASATRGVAAGAGGATAASDDGGLSWAPIGERLDGRFARVRAASSSLAFAAGEAGSIALTADGGRSWSGVRAPTGEDLVDVAFRNRAEGHAIDSAGAVLRTADGGRSWETVRAGGSVPQAIVTAPGRVVLLVGGRGILRSGDGGRSYRRVRSRIVARARLFNADRGGSTTFAYGSKTIVATRDRGRSWRKVLKPRKALLAALDFVSARTGYALGQNGRVWATRSAGRRWKELPGVGGTEGVGLSFGSRSRGYLVLSRFGEERAGYLLRTGDGGRTWRPQLVSSAPVPADGLAAMRGTDFLLAGRDSLMFTTKGGDRGRHSRVSLSTPRRSVRRSAVIRVGGRLTGAEPGSVALVSRRNRGESAWEHQLASAGARGAFETIWKLRRTSTFVAQWAGDTDSAGAGSAPLVVRAR